jgi:hypothetical protein
MQCFIAVRQRFAREFAALSALIVGSSLLCACSIMDNDEPSSPGPIGIYRGPIATAIIPAVMKSGTAAEWGVAWVGGTPPYSISWDLAAGQIRS